MLLVSRVSSRLWLIVALPPVSAARFQPACGKVPCSSALGLFGKRLLEVLAALSVMAGGAAGSWLWSPLAACREPQGPSVATASAGGMTHIRRRHPSCPRSVHKHTQRPKNITLHGLFGALDRGSAQPWCGAVHVAGLAAGAGLARGGSLVHRGRGGW